MTEWYVETRDGVEYYGEECSQALSRARVTKGVLIKSNLGSWFKSENYGKTWEYLGHDENDEF